MAGSSLYIFVLTAHNTNHFINDLIINDNITISKTAVRHALKVYD
jgi:hypothetical protein